MDFLKKLILFFSFSFGTFCDDDYYNYDDNDDEEVEIIKKKKINKRNKGNKPKKKISKGRSGLIHSLTDRLYVCADFYILNMANATDLSLDKDFKSASDFNDVRNNCSSIQWAAPTAYIGLNFNNRNFITMKFGIANTLQTQIKRYKYKAGIVYRYNLNLLLSIRLLFECGIGYCFGLKEDNRKIKVDSGNSSILKNLSSFFNTKLDPLIFSANIGVGFLFLSVHLGGEFSLSRALSKYDGTSVNSIFKDIFDKYVDGKGFSYFVDMFNISVRIHPLMFIDLLLGWII